MSILELPVSHGTTTQGHYESSAFFIQLSQDPTQSEQVASEEDEAEILFFGDIESSHTGPVAERLNTKVWKVAAEKWTKGNLRAIFVSLSDNSISPLAPRSVSFVLFADRMLLHRLTTQASDVRTPSTTLRD